jgi:hypothetical protein
MDTAALRNEALKQEWTDQYVVANLERPELKRFANDKGEPLIGRVVTVNYNNKALVDFGDGGWYDITASEEYLKKVPAAEAKAKFKTENSAQAFPAKQS